MPADPWIVLVARPTPSGVDTRWLAKLADALADRLGRTVRVGHLDQEEPSVHQVLDQAEAAGAERVTVVPLAVPRDGYLTQWLDRAVANWRETRGAPELVVERAEEDPAALLDHVTGLVAAPALPITASPAGFRSPAWSLLPEHDRHLLVCRGPRCTAYGAGATHRALAHATRGTSTLVTPTGCVGPCNLGPLVIEHPRNHWHQKVDAETATVLGG